MRPESYRVQHACNNCTFAFEKYDYDSYPEHFCTVDRLQRPKCGSTALNEDFYYPHVDAPDEAWIGVHDVVVWEKWAKSHAVEQNGICDHWKKAIK